MPKLGLAAMSILILGFSDPSQAQQGVGRALQFLHWSRPKCRARALIQDERCEPTPLTGLI